VDNAGVIELTMLYMLKPTPEQISDVLIFDGIDHVATLLAESNQVHLAQAAQVV
jgi:hypothetical protein